MTDEQPLEKRSQREALQRAIADLEAAGVFEAAIAPLRAQLAAIDGGHGLTEELASGEIHTLGGDVIGRDRIVRAVGERSVAIGRDAQGNYIFTGDLNVTMGENEGLEVLLQAYYRMLAAECSRLPLGLVDAKFAAPGQEGLKLTSVYTDLDVVSPPRTEDESHFRWGMRLARGEGERRTALLEAVSVEEARHLVLLGDPGSGKTTFVNYLTAVMARSTVLGESNVEHPEVLRNLLPVRIVLRETAALIPTDAESGSAQILWDSLHQEIERFLGNAVAGFVLTHLQTRLMQDGGLFLLDGLDEVPEAGSRRECLLLAVRGLVEGLPDHSRVLLTARPYAYADPKWHLAGFQILALAPFDERQIAGFIGRWYEAVGPGQGWNISTSQDKARELRGALDQRDYLADLGSRPLLLTLMASLHTYRGKLPEDRADLFEDSVGLLLSRWQVGRQVKDSTGKLLVEPGIEQALGVGEAPIRKTLEALAFRVHQGQAADPEQRNEEESWVSADIPIQEILMELDRHVPGEIRMGHIVRYLEERAGLLIGRREGVYAFPHRSFQEYLAACHLANTEREFAARLKALVWEDLAWWREVFLLGVGKKRQGGLSDAVGILNHLLPAEPDHTQAVQDIHWRAAALAGEAALELKLPAQETSDEYFAVTLTRLRLWLRNLIEGGRLHPRERLAAGDVLGRLGDPRPGVGLLPTTMGRSVEAAAIPDIDWVRIPAGEFIMGSGDDAEGVFDDEKPAHQVRLNEYWISRYPVTNSQFGAFIADGGYDRDELWTVEGQAWLRGAEPDLSPIDDEDLRKSYVEWLSERPRDKRRLPFWWGDSRWEAATRPVVGITWFEAQAFCRWLDEDRAPGWPEGAIGLPSEAQWEKAARGPDSRRWSWGNEWTADQANTGEAGLDQASPVGIFTCWEPYGAFDMIGNTWEWTRSKWGVSTLREPDYRYPYDSKDGREDLHGPDLRVLRGGSWFDGRDDARCAVRSRNIPDFFVINVGFRVVVSLADPAY